MVRKILCKKCEADSKKLFPNESPYPGEHVKFVPGEAKRDMICDDCGVDIEIGQQVCAFSIFTDYGGIPYFAWEEEYLNLEK
jgi:hypothetical protein